jgi:hypothetical protein
MPFAVIAVLILVLLALTAPSEASQSCMMRTEARERSGSVHLFMHARDRCWDTAPIRNAFQIGKGRRALAQRNFGPKAGPDETAQAQWVDRWVDIDPTTPRSSSPKPRRHSPPAWCLRRSRSC